ncbi:MAG: Holliday junction resolvase RuvX [Actinomycetota bacterium]|nr:Holliday junction resolvase RuvX [Actinomycetota bacterium]
MRKGRRVALDPGTVRIGVAVSDIDGILASPRPALPAGDLAAVGVVVGEVDPLEIIVGLPMGLGGTEGQAAQWAREFAGQVAAATSVPVRLVDERLSTVQAQRGLHDQGRSVRQSRDMIDSASAAVVLQHALDAERTAGQPPGEVPEDR